MLCIAWNTCILQFPFTIIVACSRSLTLCIFVIVITHCSFFLWINLHILRKPMPCDKYYKYIKEYATTYFFIICKQFLLVATYLPYIYWSLQRWSVIEQSKNILFKFNNYCIFKNVISTQRNFWRLLPFILYWEAHVLGPPQCIVFLGYYIHLYVIDVIDKIYLILFISIF